MRAPASSQHVALIRRAGSYRSREYSEPIAFRTLMTAGETLWVWMAIASLLKALKAPRCLDSDFGGARGSTASGSEIA